MGQYSTRKLVQEDVDFPYFLRQANKYSGSLKLFQKKLDDKYKPFSTRLSSFLEQLTEGQVIRRRIPTHEWVLPYIIRANENGKKAHYLFIIGAELVGSRMGMNYEQKVNEREFEYNCFFVFCASKKNDEYGEVKDERCVRGKPFYQYDFRNLNVQSKALEFFDAIMQKVGIN